MFDPVDRPMSELAFLSVRTLAMPANPITYSLNSIVPLAKQAHATDVTERPAHGNRQIVQQCTINTKVLNIEYCDRQDTGVFFKCFSLPFFIDLFFRK